MDWGEIILPTTPPETLAATVTTGSTPIEVAVAAWSLPNNAFAEVSEPVINTPNHPKTGAKKGNKKPVLANASAMVIVIPESFTMYAKPKTDAMVISGYLSCFSVFRNILIPSLNFKPIKGIEMSADSIIAVPD